MLTASSPLSAFLKIGSGLLLMLVIFVVTFGLMVKLHHAQNPAPHVVIAQGGTTSWWNFQSIDTMKYSRDLSRQYSSDLPTLQKNADQQLRDIAGTGATFVAIGTPYDDEFLPVLKIWVATARKYQLHVWFRGNWSGWEKWFDYPAISRSDHSQKTQAFLTTHPELFADGDIFSACPECENGGPGDPRQTGDVQGHRDFLIGEYQMMTAAFQQMHKDVRVNFNSMNKDVAQLVMDKPTTAALGGLVVIDHYVKSPTQLNADISALARDSGGQVILGETGVPIPDIHGNLTDLQQADWLRRSITLLSHNADLAGINYWTSFGGTTALWQDNGQPKSAVAVLHTYFTPSILTGTVVDTLGNSVNQGQLQTSEGKNVPVTGSFHLPYLNAASTVDFSTTDYEPLHLTIAELLRDPNITLTPTHPSVWYQLHVWLKQTFH